MPKNIAETLSLILKFMSLMLFAEVIYANQGEQYSDSDVGFGNDNVQSFLPSNLAPFFVAANLAINTSIQDGAVIKGLREALSDIYSDCEMLENNTTFVSEYSKLSDPYSLCEDYVWHMNPKILREFLDTINISVRVIAANVDRLGAYSHDLRTVFISPIAYYIPAMRRLTFANEFFHAAVNHEKMKGETQRHLIDKAFLETKDIMDGGHEIVTGLFIKAIRFYKEGRSFLHDKDLLALVKALPLNLSMLMIPFENEKETLANFGKVKPYLDGQAFEFTPNNNNQYFDKLSDLFFSQFPLLFYPIYYNYNGMVVNLSEVVVNTGQEVPDRVLTFLYRISKLIINHTSLRNEFYNFQDDSPMKYEEYISTVHSLPKSLLDILYPGLCQKLSAMFEVNDYCGHRPAEFTYKYPNVGDAADVSVLMGSIFSSNDEHSTKSVLPSYLS